MMNSVIAETRFMPAQMNSAGYLSRHDMCLSYDRVYGWFRFIVGFGNCVCFNAQTCNSRAASRTAYC